jgi:hypothetical protein
MKMTEKILNLKTYILISILLFSITAFSGCGLIESAVENVSTVVGLNETGTVIASTAQIRSSYAVVASDLYEVKRGNRLDILDEVEFEKVLWYRVRAYDDDKTEGWIEAQNVITSETLEKSQALAEEIKDLPTQATGQLRAATNLRISPTIGNENVLFRLDNGSNFEIVDWQYVPKEKSNPDAETNQEPVNPEIEAAKEDDEPDKLDELYDVWYRVRFDPSVSPAPAGWIFGRQVELIVPSDIVFYQTNLKKFVTWQRLDNFFPDDPKTEDTDVKITRPGSWVVLSRSTISKPRDGKEADFDGILVLGYDKYNQTHYTSYRLENIWGLLPLKVEGKGDSKSFTVKLLNEAGEVVEMRFVVFKNSMGHLRITPPEGIATVKEEK